ncbi:MAG: endonuclease domain-containing protein [Verrucomicrobia bacterium]|nr:endonuclease domain-containing protein [Verrucomicrobiota bacterium]
MALRRKIKPSLPARVKSIARQLRKTDTWAEKLLWRWLRDRRFSAYKFRRQHPCGRYILDFFCEEARLNLELDGSQHGFPEQQQQDAERDAWLATQDILVSRGRGRIVPQPHCIRTRPAFPSAGWVSPSPFGRGQG